MGIYSKYLETNIGSDFAALTQERKKQLRRISELRKRSVLVMAADMAKPLPGGVTNAITFEDRLPFNDQIENLDGTAIDLILETPGGSGEIAEEIVRRIREKFESFAVVIPGWAKSAGTIIAMGADEILMGPDSALGPIDAQITWQGKQFSAGALLEAFDKIKKEVEATGQLNRAYLPLLQGLSPGELEHARNALGFSTSLATKWLAQYKFRNWKTHSDGQEVTDAERGARAMEVATALCDHSRWLSHGRSIRIPDLTELRLKVTDYSVIPELGAAIASYYSLLQMSFATNLYKIYETVDSQVLKFVQPQIQEAPAPGKLQAADHVIVELVCRNCGTSQKLQANFVQGVTLQAGTVPFPKNNVQKCPKCGVDGNVGQLRLQLEAQARRKIV
jgi:hypothetical protein